MNFFEHQILAKKKTNFLIFLFIIAIILTAFLVYLVLYFFLKYPEEKLFYDISFFVIIFLGTIAFISLVSLIKILSLRTNVESFIEYLGGRKIVNPTKLKEKQLMNVVEEIAIASGCPIPAVYVMDNEMGINAFAAGYSYNKAVIGVTKGALEVLNRRELQGVIAHEFSHILNGDMRLNLKILGFVFGLFFLTIIGRGLIVASIQSSKQYKNSKDRKDSSSIFFLLLGLALLLIGTIAYFVGLIIQAAINRQREYLADASAVQYTRDPTTIGGALLKIAQHEYGSKLKDPKFIQVRHMLFSSASSFNAFSFNSLFATHPPLMERIKRISPELLIYLKENKYPSENELIDINTKHFKEKTLTTQQFQISSLIGTINHSSFEVFNKIIHTLPPIIKSALSKNFNLKELLISIFLCDYNNKTLNELSEHLSKSYDYSQILRFISLVKNLDLNSIIYIIEVICSRLSDNKEKEIINLLTTIENIILLDEKISFYEFAFYSLICLRLLPQKFERNNVKDNYERIKILLGLILNISKVDDKNLINELFKKFLKKFTYHIKDEDFSKYVKGIDNKNFKDYVTHIAKIKKLSFKEKEDFINAIYEIITLDKEINENEFMIFRIFCLILEIPIILTYK